MALVTYVQYRRQAEELINSLGFDQPPIDVRKVADGLKIEIIEMTLPNWFFGVLVNLHDDSYIALNKAMPQHRKNFTIAHEIAHHQLHGDELAYMKNCKRDYFHREADVFAAELCMPTSILKEEAKKWNNDFRWLAQTFSVSETAMVRKLQELGILKGKTYDCRN
ncbi:MAG: ImmA/IrrE family metallo-endopeptidase [Actinomycetia bacterium]|nr:ImmA/IrrE family metallo-endopeptidase [Actinomycetes bacterium]